MTISIGSDHAGFDYKTIIIATLKEKGYDVIDHGPFTDDSVDYPDFIHPVAKDVDSGKVEKGIIICGSGNGAAMTANKYPGVRAGLCWNNQLAELTRLHNDANVISIPARFVSVHLAITMIFVFLETSFEGGRHARRVDKISCN